MLLRVNSELSGTETNLGAITEGSKSASGVLHGELLSQLVELTLDTEADHSQALAEVRAQLVEAMSTAALVDASAVIGNFQRMVRIADGTGIPLDKPVAIISAGLREELGYNDFGSAALTPKVGAVTRWLGERLQPLMIKRLARGGQK